MVTRRSVLPMLAAPLGAATAESPRFVRQYFYDRDKTEADFFHFQFITDKTGLLCGNFTVKDAKPKGLLLITRDGGAKWTPTELEFVPISFFALDDSQFWAVSANEEVWFTAEGGRDWRKLAKKRRARSIRFFDDKNGILLGAEKLMLRTADGGRNWTPVPEIDLAPGSAERFSFTAAEFWGKRFALICGQVGNRFDRLGRSHPDWVEPDVALRQYSLPTMTVTIESKDAGASWRSAAVSAFGTVARVRVTSDGLGLLLVQFEPSFQYGGEVYTFFPHQGGTKMSGIFRPKDLILHDAISIPGQAIYVAATERSGKLALPIPTKVKILVSLDQKEFKEIPIDYRAVAESAMLAATPSGEVWAVTDNGMVHVLRFS